LTTRRSKKSRTARRPTPAPPARDDEKPAALRAPNIPPPSPGDAWRRLSAASAADAERRAFERRSPFDVARHPPDAEPPERLRMAMDASVRWAQDQWAGGGYPGTATVGGWLGGIAGEGLFFPGYPYLSELAQRPEYRIISETIATEMTREWIRFQGVGDDENEDPDERPGDLRTASSFAHDFDPAGFDPRGLRSTSRMEREDRIGRIEERMTELAVRDHFETMARHDGLFGRAHLFHEIGGIDEGDELKTPLGNGRNDMTRSKVSQKTPLTRLQSIEPVWVYPTTYNATNPLKETWYRPEVWYVMGREIHRSRLTTLIGRPVPDLLKPAYSFGGISLSQLAEPYVNIWLQTRQSVANLIRAFSVMVLMTDLETILQPGSVQGLLERARAFNLLRDNQGLFVANKNSEDFKNVSASLAGLHELQAQAQEHMSFPGRIPLVKLTGIQPSGLNASSEGEIRTFYDTIGSYQESLFRAPLTFTIDLIQLSLFGKVDPGIRFDFVPLWSLTEKEEAEVREVDARTDSALIDAGVISQQESRARVARDPKSPYDSLDPDDVPDLLEEEQAGLEPKGAAAKVALAGEEDVESEGAEPSTSNLNLNENAA
jgi:phage-related protein (TIGR01555 family)